MAAANDAKKHCIRCLLEEIDPEAYERDIRRILIHMEPHEKASDAVYHWRLSVCRDCDYLSKGETETAKTEPGRRKRRNKIRQYKIRQHKEGIYVV